MQAPYDDLRSFLSALEADKQLLRIDREVKPEPDLGAAGRAVANLDGNTAPALLFENIKGFSDARVALNVHGSWANHALMLGLPKETSLKEQFFELGDRWQKFPVPVDRRTEAPWQEITISEDINLFELLPVFRLNPADGGPYIDKAAVITRDSADPDNFGKQNVGIYRMQVKGPDHLGLQSGPPHDFGRHIMASDGKKTGLPIAIAIGNDPVLSLVASTPLAYDQSEYEMAGAWRGGVPYPIVKAPHTGLDVPWGSEVVLEGEVLYGDREFEGPFGEFTGHYSGGRALPVVKAHRVHMRRNPIFEHLYLGLPWTEIDYLMALNTSVPIYRQLKEAFPEVQAVNAMYTHGMVNIISTKVRHGGFGRVVGLRALTTPHGIGYSKLVIVVDETVDPFNLEQVMWALSVKFNPQHDAISIPRMFGNPLDPASDPQGITTRLVLDATTPRSPDIRGEDDQLLTPYPETADWERTLKEMLR
ncbi:MULTISPECIES: non-oxidative hydroxyarylic acid decarboxylases subunit C [unclassified Streptomyces]|uniref:non-oxidative hydroxyarylic acid decarboxylases subunit C n=1 Tax=unclassified Streptomyces TaxID=2593676 RepID=UPI0024770629|nr:MULTISPECIES: non-oxidative hydroxyarylic acid decarboxylases subunit C [unclassified Streptomyces]MDH6449938.1 4-hydroxybenzoate decarboxylase [Streptomyces sp. SAI-119]MDH6499612.1 4-hydroxybenzoate decarboxylase [Streptomyces sp. SAI-149]